VYRGLSRCTRGCCAAARRHEKQQQQRGGGVPTMEGIIGFEFE